MARMELIDDLRDLKYYLDKEITFKGKRITYRVLSELASAWSKSEDSKDIKYSSELIDFLNDWKVENNYMTQSTLDYWKEKIRNK